MPAMSGKPAPGGAAKPPAPPAPKVNVKPAAKPAPAVVPKLSAKPPAQAPAPAAAPTGQENAVRSTMLKIYEHAKAIVALVEGGAPKAAGAASQTSAGAAKSTPTTAPTTTASSGPKQPSPGPKSSKPPATPPAQPASAPEEAPASGGDMATMSRRELVEMANSMGLDVTGLKADDIRAKLAEAGAGGEAPAQEEEQEAAPEGEEEQTEEAPAEDGQPEVTDELIGGRADAIANLIADNYDRYEDTINPESTTEGALRCGGDCRRCPHPEFETQDEQINACFVNLHADLGIEQPEGLAVEAA